MANEDEEEFEEEEEYEEEEEEFEEVIVEEGDVKEDDLDEWTSEEEEVEELPEEEESPYLLKVGDDDEEFISDIENMEDAGRGSELPYSYKSKLSYDIDEPKKKDRDNIGTRLAYMKTILKYYRKAMNVTRSHQLGFAINVECEYEMLKDLYKLPVYNYGDDTGNLHFHSKKFDVAVVEWFAKLWDLSGDSWGYVTTGGTEGNLHGILVGREQHPEGVLYASKASHYSVLRTAGMYKMELAKVEAKVSGEMDYDDFKAQLLERPDKPAIVVANIGTTFQGSIDNIDKIIEVLEEAGFEDKYYIHCDAAMFGIMASFVHKAPKITFDKSIGSVSVSGHRFVGCPVPCGVQVVRSDYIQNMYYSDSGFGESRDCSIIGTRNGHAPIFLWHTLSIKGYKGFREDVAKCIENAHYLRDRIRDMGIGAVVHEHSSVVVFAREIDVMLFDTWQINYSGSCCRIVVMPHVTREKIDQFLNEFKERKYKNPRNEWGRSCYKEDLGEGNCLCGECTGEGPPKRKSSPGYTEDEDY